MELNANFKERAIVHAGKMEWQPSPMKGVERRMLDRLGGEVARATTIVRYAPKSHFSPHVHTGGEEFLVLEGVFQDEHGDFPAGSYVRNPPSTSHTPGSEEGCTILVKLWQFDMDDRNQFSINTNTAEWEKHSDAIELLPLHKDEYETVCLERWAALASLSIDAPDGMEILVIEGGFTAAGETFDPQSWLRMPVGDKLDVEVGSNGCKLWIKRGHLKVDPKPPET